MRDQESWDRANAVASWAGCSGFPDPTGERYLYETRSREEEPDHGNCDECAPDESCGYYGYRCLGKKSECKDEMEQWFEALERIFFANELTVDGAPGGGA